MTKNNFDAYLNLFKDKNGNRHKFIYYNLILIFFSLFSLIEAHLIFYMSSIQINMPCALEFCIIYIFFIIIAHHVLLIN